MTYCRVMWYYKKKDILEHFGKNGKNVRWLDRAIKRGQVVYTNWMYISRYDYDLQRMVKMKNRIKELEKSEWNGEDIKKLREDLEFQIAENERLEAEHIKEIKEITDRCYDYMLARKCLPTQTKSQFEYWIRGEDYKDIQFEPELPF